MTTQYRTILAGWPAWARLALVGVFIAIFVLSLILGYGLAMWVVIGPLIIAQFWMNRDTSELGRSARPLFFWGALVVFSLMTARGGFDLYQGLTQVPA